MSERASSGSRNQERLTVRRRRSRRRGVIMFVILFLILLAAVVYGLRQGAVRISHIVVYGADQSLVDVALTAMQGSYFGIPSDSTFLVPKSRIRSLIMASHPDIAAISIFRNGFTELSIKVEYRTPIARWCGGVPPISDTTPDTTQCYLFDANGFLYATSTDDALPKNSFRVYVPYSGTLGSTLPGADTFPQAFSFARQIATLGSPVTMVAFHEDEVETYLKSGTRITYVLGQEHNVFTALISAQANFNLTDGSVEYIDVRFPGKVYVKKVGK